MISDDIVVAAADVGGGYDAVCRLLRDGVAAVLGPTIAETSRHVQAVCDAVEVPHFRAHWDLDVERDDDDDLHHPTSPGLYSFSVYPLHAAVSSSVVDFVVAHNWNSFTILYDSDDGMRRRSRAGKIQQEQQRVAVGPGNAQFMSISQKCRCGALLQLQLLLLL